MNYTSIISFFEYCGIEYQEPELLNLQRIKKQIAAEFSMAEGGIITINDVVYNKQDILDIIEAPNALEIISIHTSIDAHPDLKFFLEKGLVKAGLDDAINKIRTEEPVVRYISAAFAPLFNKEMKNRLQSGNFEYAADWIPNCRLILTTDGEQAFKSTKDFLEENVKLFRNLNKVSFATRSNEVEPWKGEWARFLNWLPDMVFAQKEELSLTLINFCVEIQNADINTCYAISRQMVQLDFLDARHTDIIKGNHEIYYSKLTDPRSYAQQDQTAYPNQKKSRINFIWFIIGAILILVRLASTCGNNKRSFEYSSDNVISQNIKNTFYQSRGKFHPTLESSNVKLGVQDTLKSGISYFSILNDANEESSVLMLRINNKTDKNFDLIGIARSDFYVMPLIRGQSLYILVNSKRNQDFILAKPNIDYSSIRAENLENSFYLSPKGIKHFSNNYESGLASTVSQTDSALYSINEDFFKQHQVKQHLVLNIESKDSLVLLNTKDLNLVKKGS